MNDRRIVLTFDYELYLGRSGTVGRTLIEPTDKLLKLLHSMEAPACFFVDATYMLRMREEPRAAHDAACVDEQIAQIVAEGHRVELHVHPHWRDAVWAGNGRWDFPSYRFYSLGALEQDHAVDVMVSSAEVLTTAARAAQPDYALQAFRAGGWCAQPFVGIAAGMDALGLTIDSSVAPGLAAHTATHLFDYRLAPRRPWWRFDEDPLVPTTAGRFAELPVTSTRLLPTTRMLRRISGTLRPGEYRVFGDGEFVPEYTTLLTKFLPSRSLLTLEHTPPFVLRLLLRRAGEVVTMIAHPKSMSLVSLDSLRSLSSRGVRFVLPADIVNDNGVATASAGVSAR